MKRRDLQKYHRNWRPRSRSISFANNRILSVSTLKLPIPFYGAMGRGYGSRSAVLEEIGLLLPFLQSPKELTGRHVLLEVDNVTVD